MLNRRSGFSLAELVVALTLLGVVAGTLVRLLAAHQRVAARHGARIEAATAERAALVLLPPALRALSATDPEGSDVLGAGTDAITYRSMRALYVACGASGDSTLTVDARRWFGSSGADPEDDSLLVLGPDHRWVHADLVDLRSGFCPDGTPGLTFVTGVLLPGVGVGTPIRTWAPERLRLYADRYGVWWLGLQTVNKATGRWAATQPVAGPLARGGLRFAYFDAAGVETAEPAAIARIGVRVAGDTMLRPIGTDIALRNGCRPC